MTAPEHVLATPELLGRAPAAARHHLSTLPVHRAIIRVVECLLVGADPLPGRLLDIGCGDGHFVASCLGRSVDAGVDPSAASAAEARLSGGYRQVFVASAAALPFRSASFDSVLSNCVLEHIPPLTEALSEIARVLKKDGAFVITVPSERFADSLFWSRLAGWVGLKGLSGAYGRWFNRISRHFHTYARDEWIARLEAAGFRVTKWTSYLSPSAMTAFDLSHYYGVPTLLSKRLLGRWVLWPGKWRVLPWERTLERFLVRYARQIGVPDGAYYYFAAVRM